MDEITFLRPDGLLHSPAFSWVAVVPPGATTIHVGGINATDADGNLVGEGSIGAGSFPFDVPSGRFRLVPSGSCASSLAPLAEIRPGSE